MNVEIPEGTAGRQRPGTASRLVRGLGQPHPLLVGLLAVSLFLRLLWLDRPTDRLIFDETYYVNAARVILGWPSDRYEAAAEGLDPNVEHPPLAKLILAGSMALFGDNAYGWRLPSVALGTLGILLLYLIARCVGAAAGLALLAAFLLAFDNLFFAHGRLGTLDIFQLTFMLLGLWLYLRGRPVLAGLGFAAAALCKLAGLAGLAVVVLYELLCLARQQGLARPAWSAVAARLARLVGSTLVAGLLLLSVLDHSWTTFRNPLDHLQTITRVGFKLRYDRPAGERARLVASYPWEWLVNERKILYRVEGRALVVGDPRSRQLNERSGQVLPSGTIETAYSTLFLGAMNPFVVALLLPGLVLGAYRWWWRRPGARLEALALAWVACTYLPYYPLSLLGGRITYIYYFLPVLPGLALLGSRALYGPRVPRLVVPLYLGAVLVGFALLFPFKTWF